MPDPAVSVTGPRPAAVPADSAIAAVSWLFVPGDRPDRFAKAAGSGAGAVIVDLEDAVTDDAKSDARRSVSTWLAQHPAWVRINARSTQWGDDDVAALAGRPGLLGVVVPKADDPKELAAISEVLGPTAAVVALVESALGIHRAVDIAASGAVDRLAFGSIDFAADIGAAHEWDALLVARSTLVLASRLGGLPAPIDGVTTALRDDEALERDVAAARALGFGGKLCIHPSQLAGTERGFAPTDDERAWAQRILDAVGAAGEGVGAVSVDGSMVDKPIIDRARRILDRTGGG